VEFSRRTAWDRRPNRIALRTESLKAQGAELIDLTETNPTKCGFDYPERELLDALRTAELRRYCPDPLGLRTARDALAAQWRQDGAPVELRQLILCSGTSEAYAYLFKLLCEPGDNVLAPSPSYPLFEFLAGLESVSLGSYPLRFAGEWSIDIPALVEAFDERTKAVLAINPGNPTGSFLKESEFESASALCAERGCALVIDEVFSDYGFGEGPGRLRTVAGRDSPALTFVLSGLSKKAGLPQLKIGWICASGPERLREEALSRLEIISDTFLSSSTLVQSALPRLLELAPAMQHQIRRRIIANRSVLIGQQRSTSAWSVLPSEGGWSALLRLPDAADEESLCLALLDRGVIVQPGYFFDFPSGKFLVLSLIAPPEAFARGVPAVCSALPRTT
jgi:aspartate/methionine/tyrosine aminotransferase